MDTCIRESIKNNLPRFYQPFFTWLTAKPFYGQKSWNRTPISHAYTAFFGLIIGILITSLSINYFKLLVLVPIGWAFTLYGSRKLRLTIEHAAAHNKLTNNLFADYCIGEIISILTITTAFKKYKQKHLYTHHTDKILKIGDETYESLKDLGLKFGAPAQKNWRQLYRIIFSPKFHIRQIIKRLNSTFCSDDISHNIIAAVFWLTIILIINTYNCWLIFLISWAIPISIFFEISFTLRVCVEHHFPDNLNEKQTKQDVLAMTNAIFLGELPPDRLTCKSSAKLFLSWTIWWLRIFFYHLPSRLFVLVGDSPCHDWHHRHPNSQEWSNYIFVRQQDVENNCTGINHSYQEVWGILEAIDTVFKSLETHEIHENQDKKDKLDISASKDRFLLDLFGEN